MKTKIILSIITTLISFSSTAINFKDNFKEDRFTPCPLKHLDMKVMTNQYSFLEKDSHFFDDFIKHNLKQRNSVNFDVQVFGELKSFKDEKTEYFFIKAIDKKTKNVKWLNVDVITGNPFFNEKDILKKVKNNICGKPKYL